MLFTDTGIKNLFIAFFGFIVCGYTLLAEWIGKRKKETPFVLLSLSLVSLTIYNGCLFFLELTKGMPAERQDFWYYWMVGTAFGSFLFGAISMFFVSRYLVEVVISNKRVQKTMQITLAVMLLFYIVVLSILQSQGKLMQYNDAGVYSNGEYAFFGYLSSASFMLIDLIIILVYRRNLSKNQIFSFGIYLCMPLISILLKQLMKGIYIVALSSSLSVTILMIFTVQEQVEEKRLQEMKNEQLKVDIMLGQIQPHFLFNVLYVIQEICHTDAEKASEAIEDFSKYLRHNMDSLSIGMPIPFVEELNHTKHYVSLQQLRFGESLDIIYELECTDFSLPTLTLQPIVENAVRYGVRKNVSGKGSVVISTKEFEDYYEVKVTDDGPGFDPDAELKDGMSHMGIKNVRERLKRISGGELQIDSTIGKGTMVSMIIPKER